MYVVYVGDTVTAVFKHKKDALEYAETLVKLGNENVRVESEGSLCQIPTQIGTTGLWTVPPVCSPFLVYHSAFRKSTRKDPLGLSYWAFGPMHYFGSVPLFRPGIFFRGGGFFARFARRER